MKELTESGLETERGHIFTMSDRLAQLGILQFFSVPTSNSIVQELQLLRTSTCLNLPDVYKRYVLSRRDLQLLTPYRVLAGTGSCQYDHVLAARLNHQARQPRGQQSSTLI